MDPWKEAKGTDGATLETMFLMDTYDVDCECCSQLVDVILVPAGVQPTPDTYVAVKS